MPEIDRIWPMKRRAYRDEESSMKLSEWSQCHKAHEYRKNPRLEGRYSSYFKGKKNRTDRKQAFNRILKQYNESLKGLNK
jgi:hypothetical protein